MTGKETEKHDSYAEKKKKERKQLKQAVFEEIQIWGSADKDFKADIINMFEELRESLFKEPRTAW